MHKSNIAFCAALALLFLSSNAGAASGTNIAVSRDSLDFGTVQVGQSKDDNLNISNIGLTDLLVDSISTAPSLVFSLPAIGFSSALTLGAGEDTTIVVRFSPTAGGAYRDTLRIYSNDPTLPLVAIPLIGTGNANLPPDCSGAVASRTTLWPPNHKMADINILGVTDPEGDPVTITITGILQDEIVGDEADGAGVGTSVAQVKAERDGSGNGRTYKISFTAADDHGNTCDGFVEVQVPHDQGKGKKKGEKGSDDLAYDSTIPSQNLAPVVGKPALVHAENFPNPFNPSTTIRYEISSRADVELTIYNVLGQKVRTLVQATQSSGIYNVVWDGRDASGREVTSGIYLYRLKTGADITVRKMALAK